MSSQVVEELVMELKLELAKFRSQTQEAERLNASLKNSAESVEIATDKASEATDGFAESTEKAGKQTEVATSALAGVTTKLTRFFTTITSAVALERLASGVAKVNDQLNFMQRRLDLSARSIMGISNAAAALGGDAGAMQETMKGLNQQIQQLVIMGDASVLPFFNALGVGVVDAQGKVRDMDQIILDMADSLGSLDPRQAYAIASAMGLDEATTNALVQGRDALQEMLSMQNTMYVSTQAELDASRELNKQQSILGAQYAGLKTMMGNALIPLLTKLTKGAQTFTEFLLRNERTVKNVFEGLSYVVGVMLVGATYKALAAMTALLVPIGAALAPVLALGAAFIALYDDYKVWSEGGKSLFDWTKFDNYIKNASFSVENLKEAFVRLLTGYNSWDEAVKGFTEWLQLKGFLDETGISVDSLAKGFKNLVSDMLESMPVLQKIISAFSKIASGDFSGALKDIASIPAEAAKSAVGILTGAAEHVAGAVDTAFGINPSGVGSISGFVRGVRGAALGKLGGASGGGDIDEDRFKAMLIEEDRRQNYPLGTMYALWLQETSGSMDYVSDPEKYHYEKNAQGKRIAGHTGKVSTATGPFGILRSTGRDPGYGVEPIQDWSDIREHIRFAGDYSKKRGFAAYGEGEGYSKQHQSRVDPAAAMPSAAMAGAEFSRNQTYASRYTENQSTVKNEYNISMGGIAVQTSANNMQNVTQEAVMAGAEKASTALDQIVGGL